MKIVLLCDVPKVGKKYDVKEVTRGYARNFLLPRKLAQIATERIIRQTTTEQENAEARRKIREDLLLKNIKGFESIVITVQEKANKQGHLFAGIHKEEIISLIKEQTHLDIDAEHIFLEKPIKELGEHLVNVGVGDKRATFKIIVEEKKED
ncbi:MAG: 50S ribosomal protein L9 [Candidatus Yonathbacteria bacterium CG_4_10_14_3_um_filter_47_65]|nr:MAG: 50S ribosomal protein L9 [Candidatus Yonathbacteria bacterium CG23_combo_of_CG06-09_8_20_14_all_46_18]PIQ31416.1 MAG: 50S ribosomal protein L9 [Candidatus Yonathbacteria bacterium CG17_big_fil_post_rev_8_21_14_2_50_46_19]PIX56373.1 MAG: 50S ribosomal protein L9 [Candidatus Yonathbacteria bacterium CG_4_10_14_3_um_filter_47_65]PJC20433.1 MAG: 50S ribosomal protein L9 [Candidatus Yonathbacteria bacterium CG_4_9_14_0_2_um_filter_47_74]PJC67197.1 MAG: 50S ribosomal protein L9 [Candidatus Yo